MFRARAAADDIVARDPLLTHPDHTGLRATLTRRFADRAALFGVG
jgi:hypothetical protein